jgi:hypothetical protein
VPIREKYVGVWNVVLRSLHEENDETVGAIASEKTGQIAIDDKGCQIAGEKNSAPAHFDLETSFERGGNGYDFEIAFPKS